MSDETCTCAGLALAIVILVLICIGIVVVPFGKTVSTTTPESTITISEPTFTFAPDEFGRDIEVPPGLPVRDLEEGQPWGKQIDDDGDILRTAWWNDKYAVSAVPNRPLTCLDAQHRDLLVRHLVTSAKWRVTKDQGKLVASRRFVSTSPFSGGNWQAYDGTLIEWHNDRDAQFWCEVFPDGCPEGGARIRSAATGSIDLKVSMSGPKYCTGLLVASGPGEVAISEYSPQQERRFTALALQLIDSETKAVAESKEAAKTGFSRSLMPAISVFISEPKLKVREYSQSGIYTVEAIANPGEPGSTYLKVFEATKNTPLSAESIAERSLEYGGWSEKMEEVFYVGSTITIYEGDSDVRYPARFELWFVPSDSARPERKLVEATYWVSGYSF